VHKSCTVLWWLPPLALYSGDALAWGLYTHLYFAQLLIWAIPLADARFRRAVRRFPELLLAGACLPDASLFSRWAGARALGASHQWCSARRMLHAAGDDEEAALAAGYASHLLADVIAHNHFVPAHETLWFSAPVLTHAAAEWAMDAHIAPQLFARPACVLRRHLPRTAAFAAKHFGCTPQRAAAALRCLQRGEHLLRALRLPQAIYGGGALADAALRRRLDYYAAETAARLGQINRVIAGDAPRWHAEVGCSLAARLRVGERGAGEVRGRLPLPQDFF
jgi:hypothetical protein